MIPLLLNKQPPERPGAGTEDTVELTGPPFLTIQGEGPHAGRRAVFVRLAGCTLACPRCDTDYTSNRQTFTVEAVGKWMRSLAGPGGVYGTIAVITGGEPFRQLGLARLMQYLFHGIGFFEVQVETNGIAPSLEVTKLVADSAGYTVVCSPKTRTVSGSLLDGTIGYWKYVLAADGVGDDGLPTTVLGQSITPYRPPMTQAILRRTFVQPEWSDDPVVYAANVQACVQSCLRFGYRMGLQMHKILSVP